MTTQTFKFCEEGLCYLVKRVDQSAWGELRPAWLLPGACDGVLRIDVAGLVSRGSAGRMQAARGRIRRNLREAAIVWAIRTASGRGCVSWTPL